MNEYNHLQIDDQEKALEFFKSLKRAVEMTRTIGVKCENKTAKARDAMVSDDKNKMMRVLQEYIREYYDKITKTNYVRIVAIDKTTYEELTMQQLQLQLQIMIGFIYRYEAIYSAAKETIKKSLKKILEDSGNFTKREIEFLLM